MPFLIAQRLLVNFLLDLLYFPLWWYSAGLVRTFRACLSLLADGNLLLVPGLWARYLFVPMFGQTDWQGRILSFFVRLVNIIVRSVLLLVWIVFVAALFALWIATPIAIAAMLLRQYDL